MNPDELFDDSDDALTEGLVPVPSRYARGSVTEEEDGDSPMEFLQNSGVRPEKTVNVRRRPWMDEHEFKIVDTIEGLRDLVDRAIASGSCALDLETHGLNKKIYWHKVSDIPPDDASEVAPSLVRGEGAEAMVPQTVHKVVGYCLSYDGKTGYYVPVRHTAPESVNVSPPLAAAEIRRLCLAAQPVLTERGMEEDPLFSRDIAEPGKVRIFFWHAKYDTEMLYPITGIETWHTSAFEDVQLLYFCKLTSDKNLGLKTKAHQELRTSKKEPYEMIELAELFVTSSGKKRAIDFASLHPEEAYEYGASDGICTYLLTVKPDNAALIDGRKPGKVGDLENKKAAAIHAMYRLEKQNSQAVRAMERPRIGVDIEYVRKLLEDATAESAIYADRVRALAAQYNFHDFNVGSPKQLSDFLFTERGLDIRPKPPINEKSGQYKTDADTLEELAELPGASSVLLDIVKCRQIEKVISGHLQNMIDHSYDPQGGKSWELREVNYQFKQTGATTARYSAPSGDAKHGDSEIPIHGIPSTYDDKKPKVATSLRSAYRARPGFVMVKVDFAGEELRIATNVSGEPVWIEEFLHGSGDLHSITARAFFGKTEITKQERQFGKISNFSLLYGGGAAAIMRATGCTKIEGQRRKANFDKALPTFAKWVKGQREICRRDKGVFTPFGRWIAIPDIDHPEQAVVAGAERNAINSPVQGGGADIMKIAIVMLHREFYKRRWLHSQEDQVRMLLTVHDELVFEVRPEILEQAMEVILHCMTAPGRLLNWKVPLVAEALIDETWDAKWDWDAMMHGKDPKDVKKVDPTKHVTFEGRVYTIPPAFLAPYLTPPWKKAGVPSPPPQDPSPKPIVEAPRTSQPTNLHPEPIMVKSPVMTVSPPPKAPSIIQAIETHVFAITLRTERTAHQVAQFCLAARGRDTKEGKVLHLVDESGDTLVDPALGLLINVDKFREKLEEHNIHGKG
jgi:DNA polymerase I-like protein with 3'-5' exonuclease and polymerase domains